MTPRYILRLMLFAGALPLAAQSVNGEYNFIDLRLRQTGAASAVIGSLQIQAAAASYNARLAEGPNPAQTVTGQATWGALDSFTFAMAGLANSNLRVRAGQGGVLVGSGDGGDHELLLAVRKPTATPTLRGRYAGVYLRFQGGAASDVETCHVVFDVAGASIPSLRIVNHAASGDDVNRAITQGPASFEIAADGTGTLRFAADGAITGTLNIASSPDGALVMGTSTAAGTRDLLVVVREVGGATEDFFNGTFWMAELGGESPYAQQTGALQLSSAEGSLFSFGTGTASIAERVRMGGQNVELSTTVRYRVGTGEDRTFGRRLVPGLRNLAVSEDLGLFVASWTGRSGELTLEHGLAFGVRAPALVAAVLNAGSSAPVTAAVAPGSLVSLYAPNLAASLTTAPGFPLPTELGGARVTVNGVAAGLLMVSPQQINLQIPYETPPGVAAVEVRGGGGSTTLAISAVPQSPGVFTQNLSGIGAGVVTHVDYQLVTPQNPARVGETVLIFVTGLGVVTPPLASGAAAEGPLRRVADPGLQVLFNGIAGRVDFAGLSPGFAGLYQLNAIIPDDAGVNGSVAVGIRSAAAYSDLTDLSVSR